MKVLLAILIAAVCLLVGVGIGLTANVADDDVKAKGAAVVNYPGCKDHGGVDWNDYPSGKRVDSYLRYLDEAYSDEARLADGLIVCGDGSLVKAR